MSRQIICAADDPPDALKQAIWDATLPFQNELIKTGGITFMGLRNAVAKAVVLYLQQQPTDASGMLESPPSASPALPQEEVR